MGTELGGTEFWALLALIYLLGVITTMAIIQSGHDADEAIKKEVNKRKPTETANGCNEDNE
jgi:hypothetical protein